MYLLDTNVVSELRKPRPHGAVVAWLQSTAETDLYLSAVTLGEIQAGIELTREQDATKASEIEAWADLVAASYSVLPMDGETFRAWASIDAPEVGYVLRGRHDCGNGHGPPVDGRDSQRRRLCGFQCDSLEPVRDEAGLKGRAGRYRTGSPQRSPR
jgi:predicted nucleic acid-binding protein